MQKYDLTVVYAPDDSYEKLSPVVAAILEKSKVRVVSEEDWGQKTLSYPLKKHEEAIFKHLHVEAEASAIESLRDRLKLERGLLRWLLVTA